ncbi:hypothetical protein BT69DRAFT_1266545 [Atractiella rhizophila]|nr:hypothetical protein BT69DRAFT_1266545 [Atractiella rhizophila]
MTVTKRKRIRAEASSSEPSASAKKAAVEYTCDACSADISHTVRIHCAQKESPSNVAVCDDFDLCGNCFLEGRELGKHKNWHDYTIVENPAFPIYDPDWGADEELLLIEACQTYGIGSWADIAEHVGTRTKQEVEEHYLRVYIEGTAENFVPAGRTDAEMERETFHLRKKRRIESYASRAPTMPAPKPLASGPSCHEVGGVLPGRLEFDVEWENEAEHSIKDLEFGMVWRWGGADQPEKLVDEHGREVELDITAREGAGGGGGGGGARSGKGQVSSKSMKSTKTVVNGSGPAEGGSGDGEEEGMEKEKDSEEPELNPDGVIWEEEDLDLELKLAVLDIFNDRYDKRLEAKELIFDRNLMDYKKQKSKENKLAKEQKDIVNRYKVFAKVQTAMDHEVFVDGLLYEATLRRRIAELQEYRRMGITTFADAERYETVKTQRNASRPIPLWEKAGSKKKAPDSLSTLVESASDAPPKVPPLPTTTFSNSSSLHLLSRAEQQLALKLRILPKPFLYLKTTLMQEWMARDGMTREEAMDVFEALGSGREKIGVLFDFLRASGILKGGREEATELNMNDQPATSMSNPPPPPQQTPAINGNEAGVVSNGIDNVTSNPSNDKLDPLTPTTPNQETLPKMNGIQSQAYHSAVPILPEPDLPSNPICLPQAPTELSV